MLSNLGDIAEVKKDRLTNLINMLFVLVENNAEVSHSCTIRQRKTGYSVPKVLRTKNHSLCFVKFRGHPVLKFGQWFHFLWLTQIRPAVYHQRRNENICCGCGSFFPSAARIK